MTRQSKHKHRVTRLMLARTAWFRRVQKLSRNWLEAYRTISEAMAQAYAKARAEREGKT
jgi:RNase P subunit RPR2